MFWELENTTSLEPFHMFELFNILLLIPRVLFNIIFWVQDVRNIIVHTKLLCAFYVLNKVFEVLIWQKVYVIQIRVYTLN